MSAETDAPSSVRRMAKSPRHSRPMFPDREHFGRLFYNQARMSAQGDPADRGRHGLLRRRRRVRARDGGRDRDRPRHRTIFIGGPPLVKAATGEEVTAEELGGADVHTRRSGVADHYATSDEHALAIARRIVRNLHRPPPAPPWEVAEPEPPAADPAELYGLIPDDHRTQLDPRELIARIVDGSRFDEFKQLYGETLVCGWASIEGYPVGILANNGVLFAESSQKGAHFIELACKRRVPLLFLQNITGLHGRQGVRGRRDRARRREARDGGGLRRGAEVHGRHRRLVRRRQLRDVRPRLRPAAALDVAERADLGDGRRAGGDRADDGRRRRCRRDPREVRGRRAAPTTRRRGSGTTGSSTRSTPAACSRSGSQPRSRRRSRRRGSASSGCERPPIRKLLVANRGEIAVRVFRTCRELGIATVAVAEPDDAGSLHARSADETVAIASYLDPAEHVRAALETGADAVHPGYGFLAESAELAEAVEAAGLIWVGPPPAALRARRRQARGEADRAGGRRPGRRGRATPEDARASRCSSRRRRAAAGAGCGSCARRDELDDALEAARREAQGGIRRRHGLLRALHRGRAPHRGAAARRRARTVARARRARMLDPAPPPEGARGVAVARRSTTGSGASSARRRVRFARAIGYRGAGTAEFVVAGREFFFLELNARIQVEHPVTEAVTGLDLIADADPDRRGPRARGGPRAERARDRGAAVRRGSAHASCRRPGTIERLRLPGSVSASTRGSRRATRSGRATTR